MRRTVEYATEQSPGTLRLVYVHGGRFDEDNPGADHTAAEATLDQAAAWARECAGDRDLTVETAHLGGDRYVFSPADIAATVAADARRHSVDRVVVDPEYDPGVSAPLVRPLASELRGEAFRVEEAPVSRPTRRGHLLERTSPGEVGALFLISFGFYQVLGGNFAWLAAGPAAIDWFDVITGAVAGAVVAVGLSQVTFTRPPSRGALVQLLRQTVYVPYLLVAILKANVSVAAIILDPRLPIEPRLAQVRPALWGGLPMTLYANSTTLTPGTLSVRVDGRRLLVHTLVPDAREDLLDGGLERAVRFVFYGREAAQIPSPRDRGEAGLLTFEESTDGEGGEGGEET